jgi:hypothetical protein
MSSQNAFPEPAMVAEEPKLIAAIEPLAISNLHAAFFVTGSSMTVHNDTSSSIAVSVPESSAMDDNFPDGNIAAGQSLTHSVTATWYNPAQSWFDTIFNGDHRIRTNLGSAQNNTSAAPLYFEDGKVAVMVAPTVITPVASKFDLDYFAGPGIVPPLVNGFLQANIPAILEHINKTGITKTWNWGLSVGLTNIGVTPTDLICAYGGVSNVNNTSLDVNVIMRANNTTSFTGSFKYESTDVASLTVSVSNLAIMLQLHADLSSKVVEVKDLKISLGDYSVPDTFWLLLAIANPPLAVLLKTASINANTIAMAVNTVAKLSIIKEINKALKGALQSFMPSATIALMDIVPSTSANITPTTTVDVSTWMSAADIQSKLFKAIHLPGSHDSGAYALTRTLPSTRYPGGQGVKYNDIKFLWAIKPDAAPCNGEWPWGSDLSENSPIHVGQAGYSFLLDNVVAGVSQAGDQNVLQQLRGGIRWFDLRIYHDTDGLFYMQHGLRGPSFSDILQQVRTYIDTYPQARELIFLALSHADFDGTVATQAAKLVAQAFAPENILHYPNETGAKTFDFQSLSSHTLASLVGNTTKVMLLNLDDNLQYPAPVTNSSGFGASDKELWSLGWCRTPEVADIVPYVVGKLQGRTGLHLKTLAMLKNGTLAEGLRNEEYRKATLISVDWFQLSAGELPVPLILGLNQ